MLAPSSGCLITHGEGDKAARLPADDQIHEGPALPFGNISEPPASAVGEKLATHCLILLRSGRRLFGSSNSIQ
jgi:hypothetical protein